MDAGAPAANAAGLAAVAVLAAGASSRMRGLHKLLRPLREEPVVRVSARSALQAQVGSVGVVTDPDRPEVAAAVSALRVAIIPNPAAARGISTSIRCAGRWAFDRAEALILVLADEPCLDPGLVRRLYTSWRARPRAAMRVRYRDRPGHPVLITRDFLDRANLRESGGLNEELKRLGAVDLDVDRDAPGDLDTEEEYQSALAEM